jgi:hypothetical protein
LGELTWDECGRADQAKIAARLREAADVIDPELWESTEHEGVFAHLDNEPQPLNDD